MKKNSQQLKNRRKLPQLDKDHVYNLYNSYYAYW